MDSELAETSVIKFDVENKEIYAKFNWKETDNIVFNITVFDDVNTWSGCFSNESAEECRKDADESAEEYLKNAKACLTNTCDMYLYDFTLKGAETATFTWTKYFKSKNTKLIHGLVDLKRDINAKSKNELINILLNKNLIQQKNIEESDKFINSLKLEIEKLKTELTKLVNIKISMEESLYGKFVTLLNTKKKRIQVLEDYLQKYE
ncbi:uncharacterized protein [Battus philenor]|uniref:uncharacterized protein n=1 Tax=Battus philenor TaxID=42288 RepID=UPI0035D06BB3